MRRQILVLMMSYDAGQVTDEFGARFNVAVRNLMFGTSIDKGSSSTINCSQLVAVSALRLFSNGPWSIQSLARESMVEAMP